VLFSISDLKLFYENKMLEQPEICFSVKDTNNNMMILVKRSQRHVLFFVFSLCSVHNQHDGLVFVSITIHILVTRVGTLKRVG
jgi:hypothetical protein